MRLSTVEIVSKAITKEAPPVTPDKRGAWIKMMQAMLEHVGVEHQFEDDFLTDIGNLHVQIVRNHTSLAAIWTTGTWDENKLYEIAAASVVLAGKNADEDAEALRMFLKIPGLKEFPADKLADIENRPRPSLGAVYFDPLLYQSGIGQLATNGLALAYIAGSAASSKQ